jgi:hypothetical protein
MSLTGSHVRRFGTVAFVDCGSGRMGLLWHLPACVAGVAVRVGGILVVDDQIAVTHPYSFDVRTITTPVRIWHGQHDTRIPEAPITWLVINIPTGQRHDHDGGHPPTDRVYRDMLTWLAT